MKKLILILSLLFVTVNFTSCDDDDDDDDDIIVVDKIVGKWQLDQLFEDDNEDTLSVCEKKSTMEFFLKGTFVEKDFTGDNPETCIPYDPISGTWKNLGNSMYELGDWEIGEGVSVNVDVQITFASNKMTLEYPFTDEDEVEHDLKVVFVEVK